MKFIRLTEGENSFADDKYVFPTTEKFSLNFYTSSSWEQVPQVSLVFFDYYLIVFFEWCKISILFS